MLTPVLLIGLPLLGVPRLTTVEAIGTSLLLETSGFGTGVARYLAMRLADLEIARSIIAVTLPMGAVGRHRRPPYPGVGPAHRLWGGDGGARLAVGAQATGAPRGRGGSPARAGRPVGPVAPAVPDGWVP
jgi:hypothetical protein